jgi:hypothetical protein
MNEESGKKLPDHLQAKCDSLAAGTVLVSPTEECMSPHRQQDEPWDHYINRRINDAPDAKYQLGHQKVEKWVKRHSLPEGVTQEQYNEAMCKERDRMKRDLPVGLLMVHGYLWRDPYGAAYATYIDSNGQKFDVDEWDAEDRTSDPEMVDVQLPYLLQCPRIGQRPDLTADSCGYFLIDELRELGVITTRHGQLVAVTSNIDLDHLVGKRVRINCKVDYIRTAYYDGDGCYDRVYLTPKEVIEIDLFGRSEEDKKRSRRNPAE